MLSGVQQGSGVDPLFFLRFAGALESPTLLFADGVKMATRRAHRT